MNRPGEEELAYAYLSRVIEGPSRDLAELLAAGRSAPEIARGVARRESWVGALLHSTESRYTQDRAVEDLTAAQRGGVRLIYPSHAEWPTAELQHAFGFAASGRSAHLRSYQDDAVPPHALWVRGKARLNQICAQSVAVVGTRAMSSYGKAATTQLVSELSTQQWTIVSGGALGVDSVAHRAALAAGGSTLMVAAGGLDHCYPARNRELFEGIAQHGCLISEYPPGTPPARHRFLTRNRLVAALSQGTVVVEAAWRSGALNTLSWAEALGRVAMAVPGPITHAGSLGCHERIKTGRAQLVTGGEDIRGLLSAVGALDLSEQYELHFSQTQVQGLSRNELRVFDALDPTQGRSAEELAAEAGLAVALTVHLLVELLRRGMAVMVGERFVRVNPGD